MSEPVARPLAPLLLSPTRSPVVRRASGLCVCGLDAGHPSACLNNVGGLRSHDPSSPVRTLTPSPRSDRRGSTESRDLEMEELRQRAAAAETERAQAIALAKTAEENMAAMCLRLYESVASATSAMDRATAAEADAQSLREALARVAQDRDDAYETLDEHDETRMQVDEAHALAATDAARALEQTRVESLAEAEALRELLHAHEDEAGEMLGQAAAVATALVRARQEIRDELEWVREAWRDEVRQLRKEADDLEDALTEAQEEAIDSAARVRDVDTAATSAALASVTAQLAAVTAERNTALARFHEAEADLAGLYTLMQNTIGHVFRPASTGGEGLDMEALRAMVNESDAGLAGLAAAVQAAVPVLAVGATAVDDIRGRFGAVTAAVVALQQRVHAAEAERVEAAAVQEELGRTHAVSAQLRSRVGELERQLREREDALRAALLELSHAETREGAERARAQQTTQQLEATAARLAARDAERAAADAWAREGEAGVVAACVAVCDAAEGIGARLGTLGSSTTPGPEDVQWTRGAATALASLCVRLCDEAARSLRAAATRYEAGMEQVVRLKETEATLRAELALVSECVTPPICGPEAAAAARRLLSPSVSDVSPVASPPVLRKTLSATRMATPPLLRARSPSFTTTTTAPAGATAEQPSAAELLAMLEAERTARTRAESGRAAAEATAARLRRALASTLATLHTEGEARLRALEQPEGATSPS